MSEVSSAVTLPRKFEVEQFDAGNSDVSHVAWNPGNGRVASFGHDE